VHRRLAKLVDAPGGWLVGANDENPHCPSYRLPRPAFAPGPGEFRLMPLRSERQFNTVVYENEDIYRGKERRDVVMMNEADKTPRVSPWRGNVFASPAIGSGDAHAPDVTVDHATLTRIATMASTSAPTSTATATSAQRAARLRSPRLPRYCPGGDAA